MTFERETMRARLGRDQALVDGDKAFLALNARAGGDLGAPLATPQLATIARLAGRLGIPVARTVDFADGASDVGCWVRARPEGDGVELVLTALQVGPPAIALDAPGDAAPPGGDFRWETDAELRLRHLPAAAGARFGFDATALRGDPLTRLFALDEGDEGALPILEAAAARRDFEGQAATLRGDGRKFVLTAAARLDDAGGFLGFSGIATLAEGTPEPALTASLHGELERALRGPLARIVADADAMNAQADGPLDPHYVDYAADIASAGRHLMTLVDDLADLEAIERADFAVAAERVDLADLARRAAGLLAVRAADADVTIDRPAAGEVEIATGEFRRALQVLVNLMSNAVRYSPRGGTVWVRTQRDGARVAVIVADQGKGVAAEDQARIFDKFERVDPSEPGGSGLGLYIARRLARAMGGDLTIDSAPGEGARFVLTLPAA